MPATSPSLGEWHVAQPIEANSVRPAAISRDSEAEAGAFSRGFGQRTHVVHQGVAFLGGQVESLGRGLRLLGIAPLVMIGDLEAQLDGAGRQHEVAERRRLRLPAEPADPLVLEPADPPGDLGEVRELHLRCVLDRALGDGIDQPGTEQGRGIPLGADQLERTDRVLDELPAHVDRVLAQHHLPGPFIDPAGDEIAEAHQVQAPALVARPRAEAVEDDAARRPEAGMRLEQRAGVELSSRRSTPRRGGPGRRPGPGFSRTLESHERAQRPGQEPRRLGRRLRGHLHRSQCGIGGRRDDIHILAGRSSAAGPAQVVAGDARAVVVDRAQAVAAMSPRVARLPFAFEQLATLRPGIRWRLAALGRPKADEPRRRDRDQDRPGEGGPPHPDMPVPRGFDPSAHGASLSLVRRIAMR